MMPTPSQGNYAVQRGAGWLKAALNPEEEPPKTLHLPQGVEGRALSTAFPSSRHGFNSQREGRAL